MNIREELRKLKLKLTPKASIRFTFDAKEVVYSEGVIWVIFTL